MKKIILKFFYKLFANKKGQKNLEKFSSLVNKLMGIGSGAFPEKSGERSGLIYVKNNISVFSNDKSLNFFDIGANRGQFLELILEIFSEKNVRVYSFEPSREPYNFIACKYRDDPRITIENLGLDDQSNQAKLYYDEPGSLFASKYDRDVSRLNVEFDQYEIVNYVTLDEYCKKKGIDEIHFIKIDVEGNEFNVLQGATELLSRKAIKFLSFEFGSTQIDSRTFFKDIYSFLSSYGMKKLFRMTPGGYLLPIETYDEKLEMFFTSNYLAVMD